MPQAIAGAIAGALGFIKGTVAFTLVSAAIQITTGLLLVSVLAPKRPDNLGQPIKGQDGYANFTGPTEARRIWIGRNRVGGQVVFGRAVDGFLHRVFVHGEGPISNLVELRLDGRQFAIEPDGKIMASPYQRGTDSYLRIETRLGAAPAVPYSGPTDAAPEWGIAHRLDGMWTTWMRAEQASAANQQSVYPTGPTNLQWISDGVPLYDPRTGLTEYSDNAALAINHWIEHPDGFNLPGVIDETELLAAADACDILRPLASGGTTRSWRVAGALSLAEAPEGPLVRMLDACGGEVRMRPDGKVSLTVGGESEPVITLTDDDVLEFIEGNDGPDALARYTELPAIYSDEVLDYTETTADPWVNLAEEERLGETVVAAALELNYAPNHAQARHAMKIKSARQNPQKRFVIRFKISALPAIYEQTVELRIKTFGLYGTWRVEPFNFSLADMSVTLNLSKIDETASDWSAAEEGVPQALPPEQPDTDNPPSQPTGAQAYGQGAENGAPGIFVAFDEPAAADTSHYVAYKRQTDSIWIAFPIGAGQTTAHIVNLEDGAFYDVAVIAARSENYDPDDPAVTDIQIQGVAARTDQPVPELPTGQDVTVQGNQSALVEVTASVSVYGRWTEILRDGVIVATLRTTPGQTVNFVDTPGPGVFDWTARAVSLSQIKSAETAPINRTIT